MCFLASILSTIANTIWNITKNIVKSTKIAIQSITCPQKKEENSSEPKQTSGHLSDVERCETVHSDLKRRPQSSETVQQTQEKEEPGKNLDKLI